MEQTAKQINLQVKEFSCTGCVTDIETILNNTIGILKAKADYATGIITIEYDPSEINGDKIVSIVTNLGLKTKDI
ncbi:MAG: heavy-metal-associated domain-containing protein [Nitrospirae bacterium]|nr:heavy-metal-associated domain-containing protein [Nitrospirota bacterium]